MAKIGVVPRYPREERGMMRRNLLTAAPAVAILASAAVVPAAAAAAPSPILDAARQIAALGREYDKADVAGADWQMLDVIWQKVWRMSGSSLMPRLRRSLRRR